MSKMAKIIGLLLKIIRERTRRREYNRHVFQKMIKREKTKFKKKKVLVHMNNFLFLSELIKTKNFSELYERYQQKFLRESMDFMKSISVINIYERNCAFIKRSDELWRCFMLPKYTDSQWKEHFRLSKASYVQLCDLLRPHLEPKPNPLSKRRFVDVEKQVAITLYKLASCCEYRVVANIFGVHKTTVQQIFYKVITVIVNNLSRDYIKLPTQAEADRISKAFEELCGIPQIVGYIDGTHIPITPPEDGYRDFVNRKGWPSLVVQLIVDHNLIIRDFSCLFPGSVHDAHAFKNSGIYEIFPKRIEQIEKVIEGQKVPFLLLGDPAYPLLPWVMKDYPGERLSLKHQEFNRQLNRARVRVEITIGRLKSRWRMLWKKSDISYKFMPNVIAACCILHNIVEDLIDDKVDSVLDESQISSPINIQPESRCSQETIAGSDIRDVLCEYLWKNKNA